VSVRLYLPWHKKWALLLAKTPGIGKKTAQKLIVELKDRLTKLELIDTNNQTASLSSSNPNTGKTFVQFSYQYRGFLPVIHHHH
jgi:Holliday junction resolvasome RuvABC DNA-binding subunit